MGGGGAAEGGGGSPPIIGEGGNIPFAPLSIIHPHFPSMSMFYVKPEKITKVPS